MHVCPITRGPSSVTRLKEALKTNIDVNCWNTIQEKFQRLFHATKITSLNANRILVVNVALELSEPPALNQDLSTEIRHILSTLAYSPASCEKGGRARRKEEFV